MSFPALATAIQIAAASVPPGGTPVAVAIVDAETVSLAQGSQVSPLPTQPVASPAPAAPLAATDPTQTSDTAHPTPPLEATQADEAKEARSTTEPATASPGAPAGQNEIIVTGRGKSQDDPLQQLNAESYKVTQSVDKAFVAPVAFAYKEALPSPVRRGVRNFLNNLSEPIVFLNYLLQLKPGKAAETVGRFAINTTIGGAGLVDIAKRKPFNLPYRNNGFANTLGYYGVKPGPYFYLPLIGSTTLRDFIGNRVDQIVLPMALGSPFNRPEFVIPAAVLNELNDRIAFDDELRAIRAQQDPYVASREYYLRKRQAEIDALHGWGDSTIRVIVPASADAGAAAPAASPPAPASPPVSKFSRH